MKIDFLKYLPRLWRGESNAMKVMIAYRNAFQSVDGSIVLQHLLDGVYATVCESHDPIALAAHNGRRSVVQEILFNIDTGRDPKKMEVEVVTKDPNRKAA